VIFFILAEEGAIDGKDTKQMAVHISRLHGAAGGVLRDCAYSIEVAVVPVEERAHLRGDMRLR
jgi:hypothetical protein